jgi:2-polyprenyl-6-methoxyphenol hydroxylase-like FAD-dependent oxidoreductase
MKPLRIGVVGYGIAGATVSGLLARQGHSVEVFERSDRTAIGSGLLLQPSGRMVLDALGLTPEVAPSAEVIDEVVAVSASGRPLARLAYAELGAGTRGMGIERPILFDALDRFARGAGVAPRFDTAIARGDAGGATATLTDTARDRIGPFDLVIGADGLDSQVRRSASFERWGHRYRWGALWTVGAAGTVRGRLHMVMRGTRELIGLLPLGRGRCNFFWSERLDRYERTRAGGFDAWRERVRRLCPEADAVLAHTRGFDDVTPTSYGHVVTRDTAGPIVLIGDASHAMSPHTGQGVNLALIDAYMLAREIERSADVPAALARYGRARRRQLRFYAWLTLVMTPFFQSDGHAIGILRDLGLPVVERLPYVRHRILLAMAGLTGGFRGDRMRSLEAPR